MSAFNRLRADVRCEKCGQASEQFIQFKFGDAWQYDYALGDSLRWGGNDIGRPGLSKVVVSGVGEECPVCHTGGQDFSVIVERDILTAVKEAPDGPPPTTDGQLFIVLDE